MEKNQSTFLNTASNWTGKISRKTSSDELQNDRAKAFGLVNYFKEQSQGSSSNLQKDDELLIEGFKEIIHGERGNFMKKISISNLLDFSFLNQKNSWDFIGFLATKHFKSREANRVGKAH